MFKQVFIYIIFLLSFSYGRAQSFSIKGFVLDSANNKPIAGAVVTISTKPNNVIIAYTTTADDGSFSLPTSSEALSKRTLKVSSIGYESQVLDVRPQQNYHIRLKEKSVALGTAIVRSRKITQANDTTSYSVAGFATPKDRTIRDVIENMPGLNISENGKITYNGSPINKFYIEGTDLLDGKYNLAINNISYENIARVQIIENHQSIKALQGKGIGKETALNLTLKETAKSRWTGNLLAKGGISSTKALWEGELFLAQFAPKRQTITTLKTNNSGRDIKNENKTLTIDDLLYLSTENPINPHLHPNSPRGEELNHSATRFNKTHTASNSNIWKLSEFSSLRTQIVYTDDRNKFNQYVSSAYYLKEDTLLRTIYEDNHIKERSLETSIKLTTDKPSYYLSETLSYTGNWNQFVSNINGNISNRSVGHSKTHKVENRFKLIKHLGKNVLQIISQNNYTTIPERLSVDGQGSLFEGMTTRSFFSNTQVKFTRPLRKWMLTLDADLLGNVYRFESDLQQKNDTSCNHLDINYFGIRFTPDISYQQRHFSAGFRFPFAIYSFSGERSEKQIFFRPSFFLKWKLSLRWTALLNATIAKVYAGNALHYLHPIAFDYQTKSAGFIDNFGKTQKQASARISYANSSEMIFFHVDASYLVEDPNRIKTKQVTPTYTLYTYIPGNSPYKVWLVNSNATKGLSGLNGTIEWRNTFQKSTTSITQNGVPSHYLFGSFSTQLQFKSKILEWMEASYQIGYRRHFIKMQALSSATHQLTQTSLFTLYPLEDLNIQLKMAHYRTIFPSKQKKDFVLSDIACVYKYRKFDISLSVANIFNQKNYSYTTYNDLSSHYSEFSLRGRSILMGINWYF